MTDNVFSFNLTIGNGTTDTDATMFGSNLSRQNYIDLYGTTSGTFGTDEMIRFTYTITTTLASGSSTSVSYTGYAFITDDGASYLNTFVGGTDDYAGSGYITALNLGTGNTATTLAGTTEAGGNLSSDVHKLSTTMNYIPDSYGLRLYYDWNIDTLPGMDTSHSATEILSMNFSGTMSLTSTVPEPAYGGLAGAASALGTVFLFRRRKKHIAVTNKSA